MTAAIEGIRNQNTSPKISTKGVTITTGATAVAVAIPNGGDGISPNSIRLAATAACYARLGAPSDQSAVVATAGTGYVSGELITLTGGTFSTATVLTPATLKLLSAAVNAPGSGYVPADTVTLSGGTASTKAILTVATTKLVSVAVNAAGAGYVIGDTVTLAGGTSSIKAVLTVATVGGLGEVLTFTISTPGSYTVNTASFTQDSTSGIGTGATFNTALYGVLTFTVSTAGVYSVTSATFTQFATSGSGTDATFNTGVFGLITASVSTAGSYTALPTNPVAQGSTSGVGTGADFTMTWITAASAGDMLIQPGDNVIVSAGGFDYVSAIQVTGAGILQCSPIDN